MKILYFFIIITSLSANCQNYLIGDNLNDIEYKRNTLDYFEAKGNVKKITFIETSHIDNLNANGDFVKNKKHTSKSEFVFNKFRKLNSMFTTVNDTTVLKENYTYNNSNLIELFEKTYPKENFIYIEKNNYKDTLLVEKWVKSTYQRDFFLKERYTYNNKCQLVKSEDLNNKENTYPFWKEGYIKSDRIVYNCFDDNQNIIKSEFYQYNYQSNFKGLPDEKEFDFVYTEETEYTGNHEKKVTTYSNPKNKRFNQFRTIQTTKYNSDNTISLILKEGLESNPYFNFIKYNYENNKIKTIEKGRELDIIDKTDYYSYDLNKKTTEIKNIQNNKVFSIKTYDEFGFLIKIVKLRNLEEYKIEYDSKGNWVS